MGLRLDDRYTLHGHLGSGTFGRVFAAIDHTDGREVAIKFFNPVGGDRQAAEYQRSAHIRHPNIVSVLESGTHDGTPFIVMPLIKGHTLADYLSHGPLAPRRAAELLADVARGVDALHRAGIVHCDLKPSNIMITEGTPARAVVLDLGTVATTDPDESGRFTGTPAYAAPEHLARHSVTPAADVYALAAVMFECLTGRRHPSGDVPTLGAESPVERALAPVLQRALDPDPLRRHLSALAFITDVQDALSTVKSADIDQPFGSAVSDLPPPTTVRG